MKAAIEKTIILIIVMKLPLNLIKIEVVKKTTDIEKKSGVALKLKLNINGFRKINKRR